MEWPWTHSLPHCCRVTSVSNMMYVKEDLVLPHNISFYDLILTKARGKTGPLFNFDVHEELRANADARVESDDSHAGALRAQGPC